MKSNNTLLKKQRERIRMKKNKDINEEKEANVEENQTDELAKAKSDAEHWKNEYYRAFADMQNLRKMIEKDHKEAIKYRAEGFIGDLLPILDGFHMALAHEASTKEMQNFLIGFSYIYNNLVQVLENNGVSEVTPKVGDEFDPVIMQALEKVEKEGCKENTVIEVKAKGYKLHNHLVRPAIVVVAGKKDEEKEEIPDMDA